MCCHRCRLRPSSPNVVTGGSSCRFPASQKECTLTNNNATGSTSAHRVAGQLNQCRVHTDHITCTCTVYEYACKHTLIHCKSLQKSYHFLTYKLCTLTSITAHAKYSLFMCQRNYVPLGGSLTTSIMTPTLALMLSTMNVRNWSHLLCV